MNVQRSNSYLKVSHDTQQQASFIHLPTLSSTTYADAEENLTIRAQG